MRKKAELELDKEVKKQLVEVIKTYFYQERDEEISDLAAGLFLDFIIEKIGPHIYNEGIKDAYKFINEKVEDMLGLEKQPRD